MELNEALRIIQRPEKNTPDRETLTQELRELHHKEPSEARINLIMQVEEYANTMYMEGFEACLKAFADLEGRCVE